MIIYVLKLAENKYYIGKTSDFDRRIADHSTGRGSEWTKLYPYQYVIDSMNQTHAFTELAVTLKYMSEFGIDNVRGSIYCQVNLTSSQKDEILRHIRGEYDLCLSCGADDHFVKDCPGNVGCLEGFKRSIRSFFTKLRGNVEYVCPSSTYSEDGYFIIEFGKYKGNTYQEIYKRDKSYCNWVKSASSRNKEFNRFKDWIIQQDR
jgi:hypothetical protein